MITKNKKNKKKSLKFSFCDNCCWINELNFSHTRWIHERTYDASLMTIFPDFFSIFFDCTVDCANFSESNRPSQFNCIQLMPHSFTDTFCKQRWCDSRASLPNGSWMETEGSGKWKLFFFFLLSFCIGKWFIDGLFALFIAFQSVQGRKVNDVGANLNSWNVCRMISIFGVLRKFSTSFLL